MADAFHALAHAQEKKSPFCHRSHSHVSYHGPMAHDETNIRYEHTTPSQVKVGDIIWTSGMRIQVEEVEQFDNHTPQAPVVWQARGPVINHAEIAQRDPWLANFIDSSSAHHDRPGQHWWTCQGNDLVSYLREVIA